mgnify:CR=1 FL=1
MLKAITQSQVFVERNADAQGQGKLEGAAKILGAEAMPAEQRAAQDQVEAIAPILARQDDLRNPPRASLRRSPSNACPGASRKRTDTATAARS